jgi:hypothetical protein
MRLSDAGLHQRQAKALYANHRLPPWLNEDATRDRSNRLLGDDGGRQEIAIASASLLHPTALLRQCSLHTKGLAAQQEYSSLEKAPQLSRALP